MTPQERLHALLERTWDELALLAALVAAGEITPGEFGDRMAAALEAAHAEAVVLGREHGGDDAPPDQDDRRFAERMVDQEAEFLAGFVADLESGHYTGEDGAVNVAAIKRRAEMYGNALVGTALAVWVLTLPDTTQYWWRLGPAERNCGDCPSRAANSPYSAATLPEWGTAECLSYCKCFVETGDGQRGFTLP
jgi:hypothetical protein